MNENIMKITMEKDNEADQPVNDVKKDIISLEKESKEADDELLKKKKKRSPSIVLEDN